MLRHESSHPQEPSMTCSLRTTSSSFDGSNHGFGDWSSGTNATLLPCATASLL
jgi:hypothetical protein